jgi:endonuclease III
MTIGEKLERTIEYFEKNMPVAETELLYRNPFELLVSVILSAQCTDKRVNIITPELLRNYPDAESMSKAETKEIFNYIKSCSYPNNKAKYLVEMSRALVKEFGGIVPSDPSLLQKLPGVGRKTANVIASVIFSMPVLAVDTHVFRVANRIGLVKDAKTPLSVELQLQGQIPEKLINKTHHWLLLHGRYVCKARNPLCDKCGLKSICKYNNSVLKIRKNNTKNKKTDIKK